MSYSPVHKEYKIIDEQEYKLSVYYDKGSKYWMVVVPVKRSQQGNFSMEETSTFSGLKQDLIKVERKTKKNTELSIQKAKENFDLFINKIKENGNNRN